MQKITIIIPVYNGEKTISRAIESCLAQGHKLFELLVIDNGSIDNTARKVLEFDDERIHFFQTSQKGRSRARNYGIRKATGDYLLFLDADDCIKESYLFKALETLKEKESFSAYACNTVYKFADNEKSIVRKADVNYARNLRVQNVFPINSVIIRNQDIVEFDESLEHMEDWLFWIDNLVGKKVYIDDQYTGAIVYIHENNTMSDSELMAQYGMYVRQITKERNRMSFHDLIKDFKSMLLYLLIEKKDEKILILVKKESFSLYAVAMFFLALPGMKKMVLKKNLKIQKKNLYIRSN